MDRIIGNSGTIVEIFSKRQRINTQYGTAITGKVYMGKLAKYVALYYVNIKLS
jgi:hypothetical protein